MQRGKVAEFPGFNKGNVDVDGSWTKKEGGKKRLAREEKKMGLCDNESLTKEEHGLGESLKDLQRGKERPGRGRKGKFIENRSGQGRGIRTYGGNWGDRDILKRLAR